MTDKEIKVEWKLILRSIFLMVFLTALIFILAGRIDYWQGWIFMVLNYAFILLSYFLLPPELVQERLKPEKGIKRWDRIYYALSVPVFFAVLIISALDGGRFEWEPVIPIFVIIIAVLTYIVGQAIILWAKMENRFFSSVVRIQKDRGQTVCKGGPYKLVRHPGYLGGLIYTFATPLLLGSFWGLIPTVIAVFLLIIRTYLEDKTLQMELKGYKQYTNEVKFRILPGMW